MSEELSVTQKAAAWPAQVKDYVEELKLEMKRVTWPKWPQVRATTTVVIAATFGFSAYFYVVDLIVGRGITKLFDALTK
jgi:preprotein translocase subunit SecE